MQSGKTVMCVGEVLWDCLPSGAKPGGAPLNVALHLKALGQDVLLTSRVGKDRYGMELRTFIENAGISVSFVQVDEVLPTSEVLVRLDANKNATYEISEPVAWDRLEYTELLKMKSQEVGLIIYGTLASRSLQSRETITKILQCDTLKLIDVNLRHPYDSREVVEALTHKADIVKLNDDELTMFASWNGQIETDEKKLLEWFSGIFNCKMVVLTKGASGAIIYTGGRFFEHPGYVIHVVDSVGAGDGFLAGLVASLIQGKSPQDSLAFACATGAFVASQSGAAPKYDLSLINSIMHSR